MQFTLSCFATTLSRTRHSGEGLRPHHKEELVSRRFDHRREQLYICKAQY